MVTALIAWLTLLLPPAPSAPAVGCQAWSYPNGVTMTQVTDTCFDYSPQSEGTWTSQTH